MDAAYDTIRKRYFTESKSSANFINIENHPEVQTWLKTVSLTKKELSN